jgi:hypothetical protein
VLLGRFCFSLDAHAEVAEPPQSGQAQSVMSPEAAEGSTRLAAGWVQEADRHFRGGNPGAAIPLLERAYRSTRWTGCLLNLGMAHHARGECQAARVYYEQYLDLEAYSERRAQVEAALEELQRFCAPSVHEPPARQPQIRWNAIEPLPEGGAPASGRSASKRSAEPTVVDVRAPAARVGSARRTLAFSGFGLAGATGVAALIFVVSGEAYDREAQRFEALGRNPENDSVARALDRGGRRANTWAVALGTSSLVLLGTSAGLLWSSNTGGTGTLSLSLSPASPSVSYQARF